MDQALELCEQGKVTSGMLHLARVLEKAPAERGRPETGWPANLGCLVSVNTRLINVLPHEEEVSSVGFSPDGRTALTLGNKTMARLWDATTGEPYGKPLRHSGGVAYAAFSPDGQMVATGSTDGKARLWEVPSGRAPGCTDGTSPTGSLRRFQSRRPAAPDRDK